MARAQSQKQVTFLDYDPVGALVPDPSSCRLTESINWAAAAEFCLPEIQ